MESVFVVRADEKLRLGCGGHAPAMMCSRLPRTIAATSSVEVCGASTGLRCLLIAWVLLVGRED
jgi:hypothetical protein